METLFFGSSECLGKPIDYYLLHDGKLPSRYGIQVQYGDENIAIPDISTRRESVWALLEQMMRGTVTPATASDVIEDWLGG